MSERPEHRLRAPSQASQALAKEAFMSTPARQAEPSAGTKLHPRKRKGGAMDRVAGYVPAELGAELRSTAAAHRLELSQALTEAVQLWLAKQKRKR